MHKEEKIQFPSLERFNVFEDNENIDLKMKNNFQHNHLETNKT